MRRVFLLVSFLLLCCSTYQLEASSAKDELQHLSDRVSRLKLGFDEYILGNTLTTKQREFALQNEIPHTLPGAYAFHDGELNVVVNQSSETIIGLYKNYPEASPEKIKELVGDLMLRFGEPTTVAHDRLIYWAFSGKGIISEEELRSVDQNKQTATLATVKLSSSGPITNPKATDHVLNGQPGDKMVSAYVLLTSDPISKLFLAMNKDKSSQ